MIPHTLVCLFLTVSSKSDSRPHSGTRRVLVNHQLEHNNTVCYRKTIPGIYHGIHQTFSTSIVGQSLCRNKSVQRLTSNSHEARPPTTIALCPSLSHLHPDSCHLALRSPCRPKEPTPVRSTRKGCPCSGRGQKGLLAAPHLPRPSTGRDSQPSAFMGGNTSVKHTTRHFSISSRIPCCGHSKDQCVSCLYR